MKKLLLSFSFIAFIFTAKAQTYHVPCADLFISEYAEPGAGLSGSKAIEIYNPTASTINLANYTLTVYYNQCVAVDSFKLPPVNLLSHHVYVLIGGSTAGSVDPTLNAIKDTAWSQLIFNGNDAVVLFAPNYDTLDIFGVPCALPSSTAGWTLPVTGATTNDITLVRQPWVLNGERDWNKGQYQWDTFAVNTFSHFGSHTMYPCGYHPTVSFVKQADSVIESIGTYQIPLKLQYPNGDTTYVKVSITGGTATNNADYTYNATQTLIFPPYSQLATGYIANDSIHVIDDIIPELTETVLFKISSATNASNIVDTVNGNHTLSILDNDGGLAPEFDFQQSTYISVNENVGNVIIPIILNSVATTTYTVKVGVDLINSTTQAADYIFPNQTVTINIGSQSATVNFTVVNDCIIEGLETAVLHLYNPTNGATIGVDSVFMIDIQPNDSFPTVSYPATSSFIESAGNITVPLKLSSAYCDTVVIHTQIDLSASTATFGVDYNAINVYDSVIFYPGDTIKNIHLHIIDDNIQESTESIVIGVSDAYGIFSNADTTTVYIQDNDGPPVYGFMQPVVKNVNETNATYQIGVTANGAIGATPYQVNVLFSGAGSTATLSSDFNFTNQTVTFISPKDTQYVSVSIIDDCLPELLEAIKLKLRNPVNGSIGSDSMFTLNINPNDTLPIAIITAATDTIRESGGNAFITVALNHTYCDTVKFNLNLINGTAIAPGDYDNTGYPVTVVFLPNSNTPQTFFIPIINDTISELSESFFYTLSPVKNCTTVAANDSITIHDDDAPTIFPTVQFQLTAASWIESAGTINIPITITNANIFPTSVTVTVWGGSATQGTDYTCNSPQVITFPANSTTTKYYTVNITDDLISEPNETFTLLLSNVTNNGKLGANTSFTGTIIDNDQAATVEFVNTTFTVRENVGTVTLPVSVTNPNASTVYYGYTLSGSATNGADYSMVTTVPVSVVHGVTTSNIQLNIVDDHLVESTENILITLYQINNCTIGNNISAQVFILDNDTTVLPSTGLNSISKNSIKVYPNPVSTNGTIKIEGIQNENMTFELYNMLGERVAVESITNNKLDLSKRSLLSGVYFYKVISIQNGIVKEGILITY